MPEKKKSDKLKPAAVSKKAESAKSVGKFLRVGPRKMRLVIDVIRHKPTSIAFNKLFVMRQKSARMLEKLLKSAIANAKVLGLDESKLIVSEVFANGGPVMKRFMERSMGRADRILKRTSHVCLVVSEADRQVNDIIPSAEAASLDETNEGKKPAKQKEKINKKKAVVSGKA